MMTDDKQPDPIISVGFCIMPIVTSNFSTGKPGENEVCDNLLALYDQVLNETVNKLMAATQLYLKTMGIEMTELDTNVMQDIAKQAVNKGDAVPFSEREIHKGVIGDDGKTILDTDYHTATASGQRTDN